MSIKRSKGNSSKLARVNKLFSDLARRFTRHSVKNIRDKSSGIANATTIYTKRSQLIGCVITQGSVRFRIILATSLNRKRGRGSNQYKHSYLVQIL